MVVKGKFSRKPPKPTIIIPKNHNPFIPAINALKKKPLQQDAINLLYQIANIVTPIMKEYGLKIKKLTEMSPKDDNLLGLNINKGFEIKLRLREARNDLQFLSINQLVGTMLHELTHNTFGPHDVNFYKLLDEYTDKQTSYMTQGVNGESLFSKFQGDGKTLGGINKNDINSSRLNKLDKKFIMGVSKLGGEIKQGDIRKLAAEAAIKRYEDNKWCHDLQEEELIDDELIGNLQINDTEDEGDDEEQEDDVIIISEEKIKRNNEVIVIDSDEEDNIRKRPRM